MIPQYLKSKRKTSTSFSFSFSSLFRKWYGLVGFLLIVFLFFLPVWRLVWLSLSSGEGISLSMYEEVLRDQSTWKTVQNTLIITIMSTLLALLLGVSFAWIMAYVNVRGKKWIQLLIFMPFIIPSYITTIACVSISWIKRSDSICI